MLPSIWKSKVLQHLDCDIRPVIICEFWKRELNPRKVYGICCTKEMVFYFIKNSISQFVIYIRFVLVCAKITTSFWGRYLQKIRFTWIKIGFTLGDIHCAIVERTCTPLKYERNSHEHLCLAFLNSISNIVNVAVVKYCLFFEPSYVMFTGLFFPFSMSDCSHDLTIYILTCQKQLLQNFCLWNKITTISLVFSKTMFTGVRLLVFGKCTENRLSESRIWFSAIICENASFKFLELHNQCSICQI